MADPGDARQQAAETLSSRLVRERDEARALEQQARMGWDESRRRERELRRRVQEAERARDEYCGALNWIIGFSNEKRDYHTGFKHIIRYAEAVLGGDVQEQETTTDSGDDRSGRRSGGDS